MRKHSIEAQTDAEFEDLDNAEIESDDEDFVDLLNPRVVVNKARVLAQEWITKFFADKQMHYGGPIPQQILFSERYIQMVLNIDVSLAIITTYAAMEIAAGSPFPLKMGGVSEDIMWVINFLGRCGTMRVPSCFLGGLMLMHLELCDGVPIPNGII